MNGETRPSAADLAGPQGRLMVFGDQVLSQARNNSLTDREDVRSPHGKDGKHIHWQNHESMRSIRIERGSTCPLSRMSARD